MLKNCRLPIKWFIIHIVNFVKYIIYQEGDLEVDTVTRSCFRSLTVATTQISEIELSIELVMKKIIESIDKFQRDGSGWIYSGTEASE